MKKNSYLEALRKSPDPVAFLLKHSNLPGPRANLELLHVFCDFADRGQTELCLERDAVQIGGTPAEFVVMCGVASAARTVPGKKCESILKKFAVHHSWRVREGVAIGLQKIGAKNMERVFAIAEKWQTGRPYVQRAAVAGLCEPVLLKRREDAARTIRILSAISLDFKKQGEFEKAEVETLKKALGYGWSVAIAEYPVAGKKAFEQLCSVDSSYLRWIVKENLKKKRLVKMDSAWVQAMRNRIGE